MGHWYSYKGEPCYTYKNNKGEIKDTTLREARKLGLVPSITELLKVASAEGLVTWRINALLNEAVLNPFDAVAQTPEAWIASIKATCAKTLDKTSEIGSEIHDALETYYKTGNITTKYKTIVEAVAELIEDNFYACCGKWDAERSFCYERKFGGKVDLSSKMGSGVILDFKTKNTKDFKSVKGYNNHKMQLAAYAHGLGLPNAAIGNIFIDVNNPGVVKLEVYTEEERNRAWEMFCLLYEFWKLDKNFITKDALELVELVDEKSAPRN